MGGATVYPGPNVRDTYRVVSLWDVHVPEHDERAVAAVIDWIEANGADCVVIGGDFLELESMSQHGGHPRPASFREDIDAGTSVLHRLRRAAPDAKMVYLEGNHESRHTRKVINRLAELHGYNSIPEALGLQGLGIHWVPYKKMWRPTLADGVKGKLRYTHGQWATKHHAAKHLDVYGSSVRFGHTHKPQVFTRGYVGGIVRVGIGSPCLRTLDPEWIGEASGWAHGFGIDEFMQDGSFTSQNVLMTDRRFAWAGKVYG